METDILLVRRNAITPKDKAKLEKAGKIVIEYTQYGDVQFLHKGEQMEYEFVNCANCGDRIYLTKERLANLRKNGVEFFCSHGHNNYYPK